MALRLNSDVIRWEERDGRIIKDKIPAAPGNKWVGLIMLFSAETGEPLAIFPDGFIQGLRVAASSALAARFLAREGCGVLGILGSGWQARAHASDVRDPRHQENPGAQPYEDKSGEFRRRSRARAQYSRGGGFIWGISCRSLGHSRGSHQLGISVVPPEWLKPGMHVTCVKITELAKRHSKRPIVWLFIHGNSPRRITSPVMEMRKSNVMTR